MYVKRRVRWHVCLWPLFEVDLLSPSRKNETPGMQHELACGFVPVGARVSRVCHIPHPTIALPYSVDYHASLGTCSRPCSIKRTVAAPPIYKPQSGIAKSACVNGSVEGVRTAAATVDPTTTHFQTLNICCELTIRSCPSNSCITGTCTLQERGHVMAARRCCGTGATRYQALLWQTCRT